MCPGMQLHELGQGHNQESVAAALSVCGNLQFVQMRGARGAAVRFETCEAAMSAWSLVSTGALGQRAFCEFDREAKELGDKDVRVKGSKLNLGFPSLIGKASGRGGRAPSPPRRPRKESPPRTAREQSPPRPMSRDNDVGSEAPMVLSPSAKPRARSKSPQRPSSHASPPRPTSRDAAGGAATQQVRIRYSLPGAALSSTFAPK